MAPKRTRRADHSTRTAPTKRQKTEDEVKIPDKYVMQQAEEFLESLQISKAKPPSSKSVLQLLIASLLISARMREQISVRTFLLLKDKYDGCDFEKLSAATWRQLVEVMGEGGYRRYDEKTSRYIQLCRKMRDKYGGDARKLRARGKDARSLVKSKVEEFKGIGDNGSDIFLRGAQVWWKELFPFLDRKRGLLRAQKLMNEDQLKRKAG